METSKIRNTILSILTARMHGGQTNAEFESDETIVNIIKASRNIFEKEKSLLKLYGDYIVVGDIHGNVDDLLRVFEKCGYPPETNYLFLGDYVDRGSHSIEVIILLLCLKVLYPNSLYMIRGNHECESITSVYGFKKDCVLRFGSDDNSSYFNQQGNRIYRKFMKCFQYLPYAAVINDLYFCVHGGIGPHLKSLNDIAELDKPMISADSELATDLVWSDPFDLSYGYQPSSRGAGCLFNDKKLNKFLSKNGLKKMIRSHESCMEGVDFPLENCITIFSNTDYCGTYNKAAVIIINHNDTSDLESSPSDDADDHCSLTVSDDSFINIEDKDLKIELFNPLTSKEIKMRRVIVPDWIFTESNESVIPLEDQCKISSKEILDALSTPPLTLF